MRLSPLIIPSMLLILSLSPALRADNDGTQQIPEDQQLMQFYQQLNSMNPLVHQSPGPRSSSVSDQSPSPYDSQLKALQRLMGNPVVQKYLNLISNDKLQRDVTHIFQSPDRNLFLICEGVWIVFMLAFKTWRMTKARRLFSILFTQLWTLALFLAGVFYLIPKFTLGDIYVQLLHDFLKL